VINRYYSNAYGRFTTPDPYQGTSGGPGDANNPQTWNRYAYTVGDPVNWIDPEGEFYQPPQQPPSQPPPPIVNSNQTGSPNPGGTTKNHNGAPPSSVLTGGQVLSNGEQLALKWLQNPNCQKLFGAGLGNPENVLQSLISNGSFGGVIALTTTYIPFVSSTTLGGVTVPVPLQAGGGVLTGIGALIDINSNVPSAPGGVLATNAIDDVAETLIEELGHAYNYVPGSGGSSIAYDNPVVVGTTPGQNNFTTIMQDCNK
jgi:RHS repeat-associated protein